MNTKSVRFSFASKWKRGLLLNIILITMKRNKERKKALKLQQIADRNADAFYIY